MRRRALVFVVGFFGRVCEFGWLFRFGIFEGVSFCVFIFCIMSIFMNVYIEMLNFLIFLGIKVNF